MSKERKPKTEGLTWLSYSLASFNGTGYADKSGSEEYLKSYIAYKKMKRDTVAINLVNDNYETAYEMAGLLLNAKDTSKKPNYKKYAKFQSYYYEGDLHNLTLL